MSVPYHKEIFSNGEVKLMVNFSNIKDDVATEAITLHFYAVDKNGIPIFTAKLEVDQIRILYNHLNGISIIRESKEISQRFIETSDEINFILANLLEKDLTAILSLLSKFGSDEKINALLNNLSDLEIEDLYGAYHFKKIKSQLENLQILLDLEESGSILEEIHKYPNLDEFKAKQTEKIFQNWIEKNLWIFGVEYVKKYDSRKIALFSEGDILMESVDGYLDLIELKRPKHNLFRYDASHDCYYPHNDLSQVIGQCLFYLQKMNEYKLNLEKEYQIKVLKPRIKIIAGRSNSFSEKEKDVLRMLNTNLTSIQIITYDYLKSCGELLLENYSSKTKYDLEIITIVQ